MSTRPLWGGRFGRAPGAGLMALSRSIGSDIRLLDADLAATKAHARALVKAGLLEAPGASAIEDACDGMPSALARGDISIEDHDEDVHGFVERVLTEQLGDLGRRVHAGRSRNDLVATDLRLWCKDAATELRAATAGLIDDLAAIASDHLDTVMPGYTHLQRAQPVTLAFHLAAHASALARDLRRFEIAFVAADVSALGAGALATSTLGIDPAIAQAELGFGALFDNAMDAVADRDFAIELANACALCSTHLSRLAEEIVLWTSSEFGFARLRDEWSTGSSMMPQKRNPDMAELVRGRAAVTIAESSSLLMLLKGLPLAYNRDLQEDKDIIFRSVDRTLGSIEGMRGLLGALVFDGAVMAAAARGGSAWATDVAEHLVADGVPFRDAHELVGALVAALERDGRGIDDAAREELVSFHPALATLDARRLTPEGSVAARGGRGGPSREAVKEQLDALRRLSLPS